MCQVPAIQKRFSEELINSLVIRGVAEKKTDFLFTNFFNPDRRWWHLHTLTFLACSVCLHGERDQSFYFLSNINIIPFKVIPFGSYTPMETLFPHLVAVLEVFNRYGLQHVRYTRDKVFFYKDVRERLRKRSFA